MGHRGFLVADPGRERDQSKSLTENHPALERRWDDAPAAFDARAKCTAQVRAGRSVMERVRSSAVRLNSP
ncbi:MAG: hypothetical protein QOH87_5195 [Trebonia sp.]|nr:hypothetical protein [Trebonia sp.]